MADAPPAARLEGITFALSEDGHRLVATCSPAADRPAFDLAALGQEIAARGFGELFLIEAALNQLVGQAASASETFSLEIGEVRDAVASVAVAPDKMSAFLTVTPPQGGAAVTAAQIRDALSEKRVASGIQEEVIGAASASGEANALLVAQGREAVHGEDGKLECLIEMARERHPHLDEHGIANYRDLGYILTVRQGERLMRKIPATPGEAGKNVHGDPIPAKPGKEAMFATQLKGAIPDPDDPAILIAEIPGQPMLVSNGMTVEPTITLPTVDLTTGNVDFDGSVNVTGDVHAGMKIRATGDIHVGGTVEAATLDAGGNVVIKGGIIGHGEVHEHPDENATSMIARVHCGASCSAHFVENACIDAGDSILVDELVMQSELEAINQIVVGKPGSGHGHIVGGQLEATLLIQAAVIGSPSGVSTRLVVGTNPYLLEKLKHADRKLEGKTHELDEIVKLMHFIAEHPDRVSAETRARAEHTHAALLQAIEQARGYRDELNQQLDLSDDASVVVEKTVFGNTQVEIGGKILGVETERGKGAFFLREEQIEFE